MIIGNWAWLCAHTTHSITVSTKISRCRVWIMGQSLATLTVGEMATSRRPHFLSPSFWFYNNLRGYIKGHKCRMSWTTNYQFLQSRNVSGLHFRVCNSQRRVTGLLSAWRPFFSPLHLATSYLSSEVQLVHHFGKPSQTPLSPRILVCFGDTYCKPRALYCNHQFHHFHPFTQHPLWALWEQDPCIPVPTESE